MFWMGAGEAGLRILQEGGTAADACVAAAAALNVTEPCNTGLGAMGGVREGFDWDLRDSYLAVCC